MTRNERLLIKAAINWAHADHTPMQVGHDNPADEKYHQQAMNAALRVMHDYITEGKIAPISEVEMTSLGYKPPFPGRL